MARGKCSLKGRGQGRQQQQHAMAAFDELVELHAAVFGTALQFGLAPAPLEATYFY